MPSVSAAPRRREVEGVAAPTIPAAVLSSLIPGVEGIEYIASGSFKAAYSCRIGGSRWALKLLAVPTDTPESATEADGRAKREVETLAECDCYHLVRLGPIGLTELAIDGHRYMYFTEEFVEGTTLRSMIGAGPLSPPQVARLGIDIASAIEALWERGKIHRDIKPANVMCRTGDGSFVLLDVGIVYDVGAATLTQTGYALGTLAYYSPEQIDPSNKRLMDLRSDMFALGVVMYESLTGVHPFLTHAKSHAEVIKRILEIQPSRPSSARPGTANALDEVILRLIGKSPHLRFRDCTAFEKALAVTGLLEG
jgi:eukaryotic-like serine/threonine-protein kinase